MVSFWQAFPYGFGFFLIFWSWIFYISHESEKKESG